ncbi:MAG: FMN-binding protein [Planctomycetes bacterium]|nr:FMN-binding protein [Planctomycetota bacterium]
MTKTKTTIAFCWAIGLFAALVIADEVYQKPADFVSEAFAGEALERQTFWITRRLRPQVDKIMKHRYPVLKVKYWKKGERSAWILEEIGKVKPITAGFVIDRDKIAYVKVLIYRESHGWEIKRKSFRKQFKTATLKERYRLSRSIDGITGATMSVNAFKNMARLALFLHGQVVEAEREE